MVFAQSKNTVISVVIRTLHINIIMILGGLWKTLQANQLDTDKITEAFKYVYNRHINITRNLNNLWKCCEADKLK
jgi:hypothetical protein